MIGVICAMEIEADGLIALMKDKRTEVLNGYVFTRGKINGNELAVALSGIGKVNAAAVTSLLIFKYSPTAVINLGVCGGHVAGNMIAATSVVQYDFDTTAFGDELGKLDGFDSPYIKTDAELSRQLVCDERGVIASGDKFIASDAEADRLNKLFGAIGFDMESGAVAQVCAKSNVPFAVLRVVSDGGDASQYEQFKAAAAKKGIGAVLGYLNSSQK